MKLPSTLAYLIVGCLLLAATAAKAVRYNDRHTRTAETDITKVTTAFTNLGWQRLEKAAAVSGAIYPILHFVHETCSGPIRVLVLGNNTDLTRYAEITESDDIAFIQNGKLKKGAETNWHAPLSAARWLTGTQEGRTQKQLPVLGIAPAFRTSAPGCPLPL